ncbi:MAG: trypsin-like peptidase domain-containing protein [Planctomycetes bacterium]|nr:trypsin-like peptidase domain-containing protein [Planctomycetota bacterium]
MKRLCLCLVVIAGLCPPRAPGQQAPGGDDSTKPAAGGSVPAAALAGREISRVTPVVLACRRAGPAVVNISTTKAVTVRWGMFGGDIFDEIFPSPFRRRVPVQSLGSGFIVHPAGYIVTNAHVVRRAQSVTVTLADNTRCGAKIISSDPTHDLAVLKIDPPGGKALPYLPLGRSDDLMVGETVIAIGNPLGLQHTVTSGIVSAVNRKLEFEGGVAYDHLIQTDAPINPGSSGGPLLNIRGELIGINTAIRADAQNIGFAIPVDALMRQFPDLLNFERINRAIFGAEVRQRHTPAGDELYVAAVRPGTPAEKALRAGDKILRLNGRAVHQIPEFTCSMLAAGAPARAVLTCLRGEKQFTAAIDVLRKPKPDGKLLAETLFGMTLRPVTPELARDLRLPVERGLLVVGIDAGGPADRIGLRLKDVIFQIGTDYVTDLEGLGMILEDVKANQAVRIGVARGNVAAWVTIRARAARPGSTRSKAPAGAAPGFGRTRRSI